MKRMIIATLSTLVLSTLVVPEAQAIRPELLPQRIHPTLSAEPTPTSASQIKLERVEKAVVMPTQKAASDAVQAPQSEEPPFGYFEMIYREKYGS